MFIYAERTDKLDTKTKYVQDLLSSIVNIFLDADISDSVAALESCTSIMIKNKFGVHVQLLDQLHSILAELLKASRFWRSPAFWQQGWASEVHGTRNASKFDGLEASKAANRTFRLVVLTTITNPKSEPAFDAKVGWLSEGLGRTLWTYNNETPRPPQELNWIDVSELKPTPRLCPSPKRSSEGVPTLAGCQCSCRDNARAGWSATAWGHRGA